MSLKEIVVLTLILQMTYGHFVNFDEDANASIDPNFDQNISTSSRETPQKLLIKYFGTVIKKLGDNVDESTPETFKDSSSGSEKDQNGNNAKQQANFDANISMVSNNFFYSFLKPPRSSSSDGSHEKLPSGRFSSKEKAELLKLMSENSSDADITKRFLFKAMEPDLIELVKQHSPIVFDHPETLALYMPVKDAGDVDTQFEGNLEITTERTTTLYPKPLQKSARMKKLIFKDSCHDSKKPSYIGDIYSLAESTRVLLEHAKPGDLHFCKGLAKYNVLLQNQLAIVWLALFKRNFSQWSESWKKSKLVEKSLDKVYATADRVCSQFDLFKPTIGSPSEDLRSWYILYSFLNVPKNTDVNN